MYEHPFCKVVTSAVVPDPQDAACMSILFVRLLHPWSGTRTACGACMSILFVSLLHPARMNRKGALAENANK